MWGSASRERTLFELDLSDPETWDLQHLEMVGLDGLSERLRRMAGKRKPFAIGRTPADQLS